ncbi:MAG: choice-of-anchor J domain-containing protein [Bacteroidetes bacterium]|nr:choice-of-anchor J domain-containing protein [Bacteroidota bacterium]MBS1740890.1 choice-of-anchor J domain-containing protein [Bacteroidota bacterium]
MKKLLLALATTLVVAEANAQLALETFNGTGMPAGWTMIKVDNNTVDPNAFAAPIPTVLTAQAWMKRLRATNDSAMLTVSNFSPAGTADRWLVTPSFTVNDPKMIIKWEDWESGGPTFHDSVQVWVSTTGGATPASFSTKIYEAPATDYNTGYAFHGASLAAFNGQTVRVAFRNNCTQQGALRIDNVQSFVMPNTLDAAYVGMNFKRIVATTGSYPVALTVSNNGATPITSLQVSYQLDAATPVTQTFNGLNIAPLASTTLTFTSNIVNPSVSNHTITGNIIQVNGVNDPVTSNNQGTINFVVATASVPRNGMFEEFSSSTCAPCASFNATFDPLILAQGANDGISHFNIVKYQMNWPSPGNDQSYNPDGDTRRGFYNVQGIPDHYVNGNAGGAGDAAEIASSKVENAFITLSGTYIIKRDTLIATVNVTPNFSLTGNTYKLYMAAAESYYQNPNNTTGQLNYYHVMRKMLPDGNGIVLSNFTAGQTQTFVQKFTYAKGNVAQTNYNFWTSPFGGNLVSFVQDPNSHEILQSVAIRAQWPTDVPAVAEPFSNVQLFPNPAKENATIAFTAQAAGTVNITLVDAMGKVVLQKSETISAGINQINVATSSLASGIYNVLLRANEYTQIERLTVIK